jgi:hypothetical protein
VWEEAALAEPGDGRDAVAFERQHHQPVGARDRRVMLDRAPKGRDEGDDYRALVTSVASATAYPRNESARSVRSAAAVSFRSAK